MVAVRRLMAAMVGVGVFATGAAAQDAVQWRVEDGGNGHWYSALRLPKQPEWLSAKSAAEARGAHLATLTSAGENQFVFQVAVAQGAFAGINGPYLGGRKNADGAFEWITGESFSFTSWRPGEPSSGNWEPYLNFLGVDGAPAPLWNDIDSPETEWSMIEWSADCNNDGLVDYGQILSGELADANANGVPDLCESTIIVPTQFPTIQAAIDSVPSGVAKTISVLAGTYNQSFALNGKSVVVRGAPNNATILDGTGLATSIVRFSGGEPATAGIENLVLRNGTVGSLIFPKAPFRVGGGLYASNSAAFVRNCRFESNESDFGGGAYLYRCTTVIDDCDFFFNTAYNESGGLQLYESSGPVLNSMFAANTANASGSSAASAIKVVGARTPGGVVLLSNCVIQSNTGGNGGAAVEMFANLGSGNWGTMRISNCEITNNGAQGIAGGVRVIGTFETCVIADGTTICLNAPRNISGPYLIEGDATVCDCLADLTLDNLVNGGDLGVVLASWGAVNPSGVGDANHDGLVNGADLALVLASWGSCK